MVLVWTIWFDQGFYEVFIKGSYFFSVSKNFKKFESQTIWFDLYDPFRKHWSIKAHKASSDQDKPQIEPYCPFNNSGIYISIENFFCYFEIFSENFSQGQYWLIHILHLVNFDQSLSKSHVVWSMLNFTMFLENSGQETIQTIQFDLYCQHKVFIKFH